MKTLIIECLRIMIRTSHLGIAKCKILSIYLRRKEILLIIFHHFIELHFKNLYMINRFWTTFKTLAEIESEYKYWQLCMGDYYKNAHFKDLFDVLQMFYFLII